MTLESPARHEAALRKLELRITRRLDGLLHGDHQGLVLAAGSELGEAREYRIGDDVRRMDWNLTARTTVPHVRDTVAERELESWIVVDRSPSMDFGTALCEKRETALGAVAAFGFLNNRAGNRTGAVLADSLERPTVFPARSGRDAVMALLHHLASEPTASPAATPRAGAGRDQGPLGPGAYRGGVTATPGADPAAATPRAGAGRNAAPPGPGAYRGGVTGSPGDLASALKTAERLARRRGLIVVVSDFLDSSSWQMPLRRLAGRHQVVCVEVRDPREDELPAVGLLTLVDPETGRRVEVQTDKPRLRQRFAEAAAAKRGEIAGAVRAAGARHVVLSTDRDWFLDLLRAVDRWRRRR